MHRASIKALALAIVAGALTGCAVASREQGARNVNELVAERGLPPAAWPTGPSEPAGEKALVDGLLGQSISTARAMQLAFLRNSGIREAYAELGIAQAEVIEASRLPNPSFGFVDLAPRGTNGPHQITRSVTLGFADVLLMPARRRFARGDFGRIQQILGNSLLELAAQVETAWYEYVSARQVGAMRDAVTKATEASAEFAERSFKAGNITPRDLALELAAASEARIEATRAAADAIRARTRLAEVMGVPARLQWQTPDVLPGPGTDNLSEEELVDAALKRRLDLAAARSQIVLLEEALGVTRRWRFLGDFDAGYEWENETDGVRLRGPSFAVGVPLFDWGGGRILRAQSDLEIARARLAALELGVRNEVSLGLDRLAASRSIVERYRTALVPQREEVVRRELERYSFTVGGVFELLQAKREEYDAYQEYLESVRDYWVACTELRRAIGGRQACNAAGGESAVGVEAILQPKREHKPDEDGDRP